MNLACPHCRRVLEFSGQAPVFCGFCGQSLAGAVEVATAEYAPAAESFANAATLPPDPTRAAANVPPVDRPGREVAGYVLVRELGRGGMGVVWEAEQTGSGRHVALKLLVSGREHAPETLERFVREGQLAAALSHPRSTFVYEAGAHDGQPYISMELMPGRTLSDIIDDEGALPVPRAVDLILDVIEGLEAAHANGVIHRDVKPSNCFIDRDGRVKVGDFGLSKSLESNAHLTRTGAFMGTPLFAAPEQVRGGAVDERTDIYAVGATLFYLIARRGPYTGDATAVIAQIASDPAPSLKSLCPTVPKDLDRIISQTLEKDPARRVPTLGALRLALQPFASTGLTPAPLGHRLGAYFVDTMFLGLIFGLIAAFAFVIIVVVVAAHRGIVSDIPPAWIATAELLIFAGMVLYFAMTEGISGRSIGKRWLGLRVVRADGSRPGMARATLRALLVPGLTWLTTAAMIPLLYPSHAAAQPELDPGHLLTQHLLGPLALLPVMACLATMRPRNGYRGLHDFASKTRVVALRPAESGVRGLDLPIVKPLKAPDGGPGAYGPFQVHGRMGCADNAMVFAAKDQTLKRRAWVFVQRRYAEPVSARRAQVARVARPRWLQSGEIENERWEAFEAVVGSPITELDEIPWEHGRVILRDLAEELAAAVADDTLPLQLSLDQVWLDRDGRVKLLDAPLDDVGSAHSAPVRDLNAPAEAAMVLLRAAVKRCARGPALPVFASGFVQELQRRPNDASTLAWSGEQLRAAAVRPASVRWSDRLVSMGVSGGTEYAVYTVALALVSLGLIWINVLPAPVTLTLVLLTAIGVPLAAGFWTAGGPVFRLMGIAVRRADGTAPSRLRCGVRNVVAWFLPLLAGAINVALMPIVVNEHKMPASTPGKLDPEAVRFGLFLMGAGCGYLLLMLLQGIGMIFAIAFPQRSPQDIVAGTRLVPK